MIPDDELIEAVVGGDLDPACENRLRARLADAAFVAALGEALALVGALRAVHDGARRDAELHAVLRRLLPAPGTEPFAERVMQRVRRRSRRVRRSVPRRRGQRARRTGGLLAIAVVGLVLVVGGVAAWSLLRQPAAVATHQPAPVVSPRGPTLWRLDGAARTVLGADGTVRTTRELVRGDELEARGGDLVLVRSDGSRVGLEAGARLRVHEATGLELVRGRLRAVVRPQGAAHPFRVHTPHAVVEVVGTVFSVTAAGERGAVAVEEGRVRVRAGDHQRLLLSGERLELPMIPQGIRTVALVDAPGGSIVAGYERIEDGAELLLRELPTAVNFVVGVADEIESMRCTLRDDAGRELGGSHQENRPFSVFGDLGDGTFERWNLQPGSYRLRLEAFTGPVPEGEPRELREIAFTVSAR